MKDQNYNAPEVEKKWQKKWNESGLYKVDASKVPSDKKYYNLVMFPYPSGDKLHVGHWYNYAPADSHGRYMRMKGYNVLQPIGFDSFGLPAENYAIKTGVHPKDSIKANVEHMIAQLSRIGTMYDWDKTVVTSSPEYYKWTQWIFLQLYKKGLAYKKKQGVNYCPSCQTVLANEQVQDGTCDRCGSEVTKKDLEQWFFNLSSYAEKLLDYEGLDWPEKTILMQQNWIGRSEGVNFKCKIKGFDYEFDVFDSVPQTFKAQTFSVIAAEHPLLPTLIKGSVNEKEIQKCIDRIKKKRMSKRFNIDEDLDGIFTGLYIQDPYGTGDLPLWVASFVVMDYGSGVVNCSAHDERDFAFAKKFGIPLRPVMFPADTSEAKKVRDLEYCYHHVDNGILEAPEEFKGRKWGEVRKDVIKLIEKKKMGKGVVNYRLRDWLLSRQRYWGTPIPIVYCEKCGEVPVPEKDLPVELPLDVEFKLQGEGKSPLYYSKSFMDVKCPKCGSKATRESDTMDTFVCSSWYYLRYPSMGVTDAKVKANSKSAFDKELTKKWLPVDMYIGGPEHACMHLLYARFINMALNDLGLIDFKEPFKRLVHQGMVTKDGAKMSKSKGNTVSPDEFVEKYGSDVFRMYLMFMGPFTQGGDWSDKGIIGIVRFADKFFNLVSSAGEGVCDKGLLHKTIKKVTADIESFHFNTAISALMELVNAVSKTGLDKDNAKILVQLIAPMAPHLAEECYALLGGKYSVFDSTWPLYDAELARDSNITYGIQVNGKLRGTLDASASAGKDEVLAQAKAIPNVSKYLEEGKVVKEIFVQGKIVGFVVR